MSLTPTDNWLRAANSGSAEPILKLEFSPTVAYDEKRGGFDWQLGENLFGIVTDHDSDELRLARNRDVFHPEQQLRRDKYYFPMQNVHIEENGKVLHDGATLGRFVQIFRSATSYKLKYLRLMTDCHDQFTGRLTVRIVAGLSESVTGEGNENNKHLVDKVLENTRELGKLDIDYSSTNPIHVDITVDGKWVVYDFSEQNVWIPGGDVPCAIVLEPSGDQKRDYLWFLGSLDNGSYEKGCLYWGIPSRRQYRLQTGHLAFQFVIDAFAESGGGEWVLDLGRDRPSDTVGELELRYCEPDGTSATFKMAEADSFYGFNQYTKYNKVSDGSKISKRFIRVRVMLISDSLGIDTPRIISIRAAFKRRINWLLASRPVFGYPNLVAEAPDYSAEGDPLSGSGSATDTSRIVLLDAGGIVTDLIAGSFMKNDRVRIWLGFDTPYFQNSSDASSDDWLPFKTIWIEDWEPGDGSVTLHCYDQQIRFRQAQAPKLSYPASQTEHIYYDRANPIAIKYDMLRRSGIRPVEIDYTPAVGKLTPVAGDNGSFSSLASSHDWQMNCSLRSSTSLESVDSDLNRHLLAFQLVDEKGRWVVRHADFSCVHDSQDGWLRGGDQLPTVESGHVLSGSETYSPGMKYLRNWGVVYFGGEGGDENAYTGLTISPGNVSAKAYKESQADKLLSSFIPADRENQAREVALRRRLLQHHGLRTVEFSTGLCYAGLQIGDHINFNNKYYCRPGALLPNPLLVMITRKNIDQNLSAINWAGVVLMDAEQLAQEEHAVAAPLSLEVAAQGDGTVVWQWPASSNEEGGEVRSYELFQRLSHLRSWGTPVATVQATREAFYSWSESAYGDQLEYDFGVRAVHSSGVTSEITVHENVVLTGPLPAGPSQSDWSLTNEPGVVKVKVLNHEEGVIFYHVYHLTTGGWQPVGSFLPAQDYVYNLPQPFSRKPVVLAITAENRWGESEISSVRAIVTTPLKHEALVPFKPILDSEGGIFPAVSIIPVGDYFSFTVTLKLLPPDLYQDYIDHYVIQRRHRKDADGEPWSEWYGVEFLQVDSEDDQKPSPGVIYFINSDSNLAPGLCYQYQAWGVSKWGTPGEVSTPVELEMIDDQTAPDKPVITSISSETGRVKITIQPAKIGGGPCPDFHHFVIQGNPNSEGWVTLAEECTGTTFDHAGADSDLGINWQYRVYAVDLSGNVSPASDTSNLASMNGAGFSFLAGEVTGSGTPGTLSQITDNGQAIDLRVEKNKVINSINLSGEGIRIDASRLSINGYTEFASGYNPYGKLDSLGGQYDSASSGPRVRIFPDSNTGILVTDGTNDVFKAIVGGTDVGDVIIGSSERYVKWDHSAGSLEVRVGSDTDFITMTGSDTVANLSLWDTSAVSAYYPAVFITSGAGGFGDPFLYISDPVSGGIRRINYYQGGKIIFSIWSDNTNAWVGSLPEISINKTATMQDVQLTINPGAYLPLKLVKPYSSGDLALHSCGDVKIDSGYGLFFGSTEVLIGQMPAVPKPSTDTASLKAAVDAIIDNMKAVKLMS